MTEKRSLPPELYTEEYFLNACEGFTEFTESQGQRLSRRLNAAFAVAEVRRSVAANRQERDRLTLWGRRLLGEAITQAQYVMAQRDELTDLVITATGDLNNIAALFDRMQISHAARMAVLGLG